MLIKKLLQKFMKLSTPFMVKLVTFIKFDTFYFTVALRLQKQSQEFFKKTDLNRISMQ